MNIQTRYGVLSHANHVETDTSGAVISCVPAGAMTLDTPFGRLTPQFSTDDVRRPKVEPLLFYPDGTLRGMALEERLPVETPIGPVTAELVNFYPDGSLRRIFPLNGKLSGYWTEKEEAALAGPLRVPTPAGEFSARIISLQFHPDGGLRSVTLWPGETAEIDTPFGRRTARVGIAVHPGGALRSFEPERMIEAPTPIGALQAFEPDATGIHGDLNSLEFTPEGQVAALATPFNTVTVTQPDGLQRTFSPARIPSLCDEREIQIQPLRISFPPGKVAFGDEIPVEFPLDGHSFAVGKLLQNQNLFGPVAYHCGV